MVVHFHTFEPFSFIPSDRPLSPKSVHFDPNDRIFFIIFQKLKMKDRTSMDPSVRVAIVGFHKDIEVEYNLYQMSIVGSYRDAMHRITQEKAKALQAVHQLLNYVAYVRTGDSLGFLDIFQKLAHFFDHRSHKRKNLIFFQKL